MFIFFSCCRQTLIPLLRLHKKYCNDSTMMLVKKWTFLTWILCMCCARFWGVFFGLFGFLNDGFPKISYKKNRNCITVYHNILNRDPSILLCIVSPDPCQYAADWYQHLYRCISIKCNYIPNTFCHFFPHAHTEMVKNGSKMQNFFLKTLKGILEKLF